MTQIMAARLIKAGYIPLPFWLIVTTIAGFLVTGYNPIASHVSVMSLETGLVKWMVNMAAVTTGLALIVFSVGIAGLSRLALSGGALCYGVFGIAMVTNGIWPMGSPMHGFYAIGILNILGPALTYMDVGGERLGRRFHAVTVAVSLANIIYIWILIMGFDPDHLSGLTQRIFASIGYFWPLWFARCWLKSKSVARAE